MGKVVDDLKRSLLKRLDKESLESDDIEKAKPDLRRLNQLLSQRSKERAELMREVGCYE